ncbi:lipoyl(octanoyl) transferase LipB [Rhodococcus rhodnii]|uniref:Octanoyltransferase n=2 Tax=Rhodococcus rhodnii TaxID=38312 RepID=R7WSC0_9NOCA|nr:lipoyl(octanoyl) transferase LipB [Rhodococcus rhodnii]EOM78190.1 lipoyltransferase [Rhodococcus rhodnii LMG 5362]TXG91446.1 lipoyl(octanoyl) transferase LipB [Rhodococcus rhodnii]
MSSTQPSARTASTPVVVDRLGLVDYMQAWERQRAIANERAEGRGDDRLLLLEHPATYTAGRRTEPADRPVDGTPVIDVDRGGKITWHGPGQLVGYPIVRLAEPVDVVQYVRRIEEALIAVVSDLGIVCGRIDGRSGVWLAASVRGGVVLPERKVAAIGIRVQRGVAMHGFSLNCNSVLDGFDAIVPCGIRDAGVTTLSHELGRDVTVDEVVPAVTEAVLAALDGALPVRDHELDRTVRSDDGDAMGTAAEPVFTTLRLG